MAKTESTDNIEFLYHGDIWQAFFGKKCSIYIPRIICWGLRNCSTIYGEDDFSFSENRPKNSLISNIFILKHLNDQNTLYSIFPFCKGMENNLLLCDIHNAEYDDPTEGYVLLKKGNAAPMWMYNPLFAQQKALLTKLLSNGEQPQQFCIAGIGWNIEKRTDTLIQVSEGPLYENALRDFLKENPDKTADDFPYAELNIRHLNALVSKTCEDAYDFVSDISAIRKFKYYGLEFYCFEIEVLIGADDTEHGMKVNLFVNKKLLGDYIPQIGDNISGIMQLTAYINTDNYFANTDKCRKDGLLYRIYETLANILQKILLHLTKT